MTSEATTGPDTLRIGLAERWFSLGVATCTVAVAGFLLARLTAWPPHEDETLALFVGRESLPDLFRTVQGERGGAPLHFLVAWVVVHLGGGLEALRMFSALFAVASVPAIAALGARLGGRAAGARRRRDRLGQLDAPLPRRLRAHVLALPVREHALVPGAARRGRAGRAPDLGVVGGCDAGDDRSAPLRCPRPRLAGSVCTRARAYA